MKQPKTTVVIACHNAEPWLHKLLAILGGLPCRIAAVDDGSRDRTWEILSHYPSLYKIRHDGNLGFARTNNDGAGLTETPYLLFLNQDTEPKGGFIKAMEARIRRCKEIGIVGAKLVFPTTSVDHLVFRDRVEHLMRIAGRLDHAGIDLNPRLLPFEVGRNRPPLLPQFNEARMYPAVTAACLIIRRELFEELGGFHEGFLNGWEDTDLCLRAWEAGHQVWYEPEAVVYHYHSTCEARFAHENENVDLWIQRWHTGGRLEALAEKYKKEWGRQA